jgi:hypothetical protein
MSSETRTLLVVLVLCAFVAFGCLIIPIGIGAVLYFRVQQQQVAVQAEFNQALAEQQRMQAEAAARHAELQQQIETQIGNIPPIGAPPPGFAPNTVPPGFPQPSFPPSPLAPDAAELSPADATPLEPTLPAEPQRRTIYLAIKQFKQLDALFAELNSAASDDPNMQAAAAQLKSEKEKALRQLATQFNITPAQLDEIRAEGDRAGW